MKDKIAFAEKSRLHNFWFLVWTVTILVSSFLMPNHSTQTDLALFAQLLVLFTWLMFIYHLFNFIKLNKLANKK